MTTACARPCTRPGVGDRANLVPQGVPGVGCGRDLRGLQERAATGDFGVRERLHDQARAVGCLAAATTAGLVGFSHATVFAMGWSSLLAPAVRATSIVESASSVVSP
ncbi:hypothetical protein AB0C38_23000 [Amycolatopsis sp. NPDC048633]|uniref:hypothetical protein n=1 Tax=Amycolatopsis sp. NPDC048633 TaxID=3157095 RepID=UPI0034034219